MGSIIHRNLNWHLTVIGFVPTSQVHLLKHRAQIYRIRLALAQRQLQHREAFDLFDSDRTGMLSAGKLWAGLEWLGVPCEVDDLVDVLRTSVADDEKYLRLGYVCDAAPCFCYPV